MPNKIAKNNNVSYEVRDNENKLIFKGIDESCYAKIFSGKMKNNINEIILYVSDDDTQYDEQDFTKWIELLNEIGFDVKYQGLNEKYITNQISHVISIPITGNNIHRGYLQSLLTVCRYLFELPQDEYVKMYFELEEELNIKTKEDKFKLLNFIHIKKPFHSVTGHLLKDDTDKSMPSYEDFLLNIKNDNLIFDSNKTRVHDIWSGDIMINENDFKIQVNKNMKKIYVVGGDNEYANWIPFEFKITNDLEKADLVLFTGGEDVDPSFYNEPRHYYTYTNINRDKREIEIYNRAQQLGIKCLGICRGLSI